jgi:hypothetical protein
MRSRRIAQTRNHLRRCHDPSQSRLYSLNVGNDSEFEGFDKFCLICRNTDEEKYPLPLTDIVFKQAHSQLHHTALRVDLWCNKAFRDLTRYSLGLDLAR